MELLQAGGRDQDLTRRSFRERAARGPAGRVTIPLPFDPSEAWGRRDRYHVTGTIDGVGFRTTLSPANGWTMAFGPKSSAACRLEDGQSVAVELWPEGPQGEELAADIAEALSGRPEAKSAFDSLATFYRKGWLRWIDGTKRRPDIRAERIAEMVRLVEAGHKERPGR